MDAESNLAEVAVSSNNGSTTGEPTDPTVLKEKLADELKSAASLKGGGDGPALDVPLEKDDLLERLDKIDTDSSDAAAVKSSSGPASTNDVDMENDDLIQRLEAMEKGEDDTTAAKDAAPVEEKKKDEVDGELAQTNHQNGLEKENEADLLQDEGSKENVAENMVVDDEKEENKKAVSSTEPTSNGASNKEEMEQPSSSVKRRHSEDEESQITEPSTKKPHVEEDPVDAPKELEPSKPKAEEKIEPEVKDSPKENETDKEPTEKPDESSKSEEVSISETSVTKNVTKEDNEEQIAANELASSTVLDPKKEEKKEEETLQEKNELKESEEPMETVESSELFTKDKNDASVSGQKDVVESTQEQKQSEQSASSSCLDPTKEEQKEEEIVKEDKEVKNPDEPVDAEPSESVKDENDVSVSEKKEEVDSTHAMEQTADSSEAVVEKKLDSVEAESKIDLELSGAKKETVEKEPKLEEKIDDVTEEKLSEEKVKESATEVEETASPEKVEDAKEPQETEQVDQESTPSEPVEDVPKPLEAEKAIPESLPEPPAAEAEPKALPDTEPNTESSQEEQPTSSSPAVVEEKTDDAISSSSEKQQEQVLPSSTEVDSAAAACSPTAVHEQPPCEAETVTSSDEKPPTEPALPQEVDSTPDGSKVAASEPANEDEAMEVDSESVAETSSKAEVSEPPCTKKRAYECTDDEVAEKASEATPQKAEAVPESVPEAIPEQEPVQEATEQEEEKMEVDSVAPTQSKPDPDVTESINTTSEELVESLAKDDSSTAADSQSETAVTVSELNKNLDATESAAEDSKSDASKTMDDSIECSLPTSSSDKMADRLKQRLDLISNGSSTPNAAVSSSNVYNSTPIQKQFEISSENVSKISRHSADHSHQTDEEHSTIAVGDQSSIADEKEAVVASTSGVSKAPTEVEKQLVTDTSDDMSVPIKEGSSLKTESSEVDSCTASSALNTADEINMYATNARKFNGISSTSGSELEDKSTVTPTVSTTDTPTTVINKLDLTPALTSEEMLYEVSVWFDGSELQFLSIEKLENKSPSSGATAGSTQDLTGIDSSKQSSNGSVGSLGPFPLPPARPAADSAMSHSSTTETSSGTSQLKSSLPKMKHTVRGAKALATLMIEEFTKIKRAFSKDGEVSDTEPETPMKTPKGRPASVSKKGATPSARGQKRSRTDSDTTEEDLTKSKQAAKQVKKGSPSVAAPETTETAEPAAKKEDEQCCLARWSDRKYYAGKVAGYKGDNKFMIVFEDGASKALSKDVIVFGDKDTLPIMGHSIHALTGGDTYEPGIVQALKRNESDEVVYSVEIATGIVEVTASDMYLTEEQAKYINKACKANEASDEKSTSMQSPQSSGRRGANTPVMQTPEEGSGAVSAEKGSRSTRRRGADKPQTPVTPEAGYSGGVGKKGRRGRRLS